MKRTSFCMAAVFFGFVTLLSSYAFAGQVTFFPNQLFSVRWAPVDGAPINGHYDQSFATASNWPNLMQTLSKNGSQFGITASEIGFMQSSDFAALQLNGIQTSIDTPGWGLCYANPAPPLPIPSGPALAQGDLLGTGNNVTSSYNIFQHQYKVIPDSNRTDPTNNGWFVTVDGKNVVPNEIVLGHRVDDILPIYKNKDANGNPLIFEDAPWAQRMSDAKYDPCPFYGDSTTRLNNLVDDYVAYAQQARAKFGPAVKISFFWPANDSLEWEDPAWLDNLNAAYPLSTTTTPPTQAFQTAFESLAMPRYAFSSLLDMVVTGMCTANVCPSTVYMDIGSLGNTAYTLNVLNLDRNVLQKHNVTFGIALTDECDTVLNTEFNCYVTTPAGDPNRLVKAFSNTVTSTDLATIKSNPQQVAAVNALWATSVMNKFNFYVQHGIIDQNTAVRFESWMARPIEVGGAVNERTLNSTANVMNNIFLQPLFQKAQPY